MAEDFDAAVAECKAARIAAAAPCVFSTAAEQEADSRTKAQFLQSLPHIKGGFATVKPEVLKAATLFGEVAKAIARFHDPKATQISKEDANTARLVMERECRLKIARAKGKPPNAVDVSDGLVCS